MLYASSGLWEAVSSEDAIQHVLYVLREVGAGCVGGREQLGAEFTASSECLTALQHPSVWDIKGCFEHGVDCLCITPPRIPCPV